MLNVYIIVLQQVPFIFIFIKNYISAQVTSGGYLYTFTPCDAELCGDGEPSAVRK